MLSNKVLMHFSVELRGLQFTFRGEACARQLPSAFPFTGNAQLQLRRLVLSHGDLVTAHAAVTAVTAVHMGGLHGGLQESDWSNEYEQCAGWRRLVYHLAHLPVYAMYLLFVLRFTLACSSRIPAAAVCHSHGCCCCVPLTWVLLLCATHMGAAAGKCSHGWLTDSIGGCG